MLIIKSKAPSPSKLIPDLPNKVQAFGTRQGVELSVTAAVLFGLPPLVIAQYQYPGAALALAGVVAVLGAGWLGEHPEIYIPYGVMVMMLTGAVGGFFGEVDARLRRWVVRKLTDSMKS